MAELPVALWFLLCVFTFPFVDLATVAFRASFFMTAAQEAVHQASHCQSFKTSISASSPSAQVEATAEAQTVAGSFTGVTISSVNTYIIATNISTLQSTVYSAPLTTPANTSTSTYMIEVVVKGEVNPIISYNQSFFGTVPGLTAPIPLTAAAQEFCENPQGLTQ